MKGPPTSRESLWGAGLFLLVFLAYLPALHGSFIWDDSVMVADNQMLRNARGLHDLWFTTRAVDPLPVTMTALWLQWHCWDGHPLGYHVVNVLAHGLGALLLWRVLLHLPAVPGWPGWRRRSLRSIPWPWLRPDGFRNRRTHCQSYFISFPFFAGCALPAGAAGIGWRCSFTCARC